MNPSAEFIFKYILPLFLYCFSYSNLQAEFENPENNWWPFYVYKSPITETWPEQSNSLGPFFEHRKSSDWEVKAFRPFVVGLDHQERDEFKLFSLYPVFSYREKEFAYNWSFLSLVRSMEVETKDQKLDRFEIWPLYWSNQTGNPESSYRAVFPIHGTLKHRLFHKRIHWTLFPIYSEWEKKHHTDHIILWPIFRKRIGPESSGFAVWPLAGSFEREAYSKHWYALWPFIYSKHFNLDKEVPSHNFGVLPFYASETAHGLESRTFIWPFFGYTYESKPRFNYKEYRYLWPLVIQGRGENEYENRVLPFYSFYENKEKNYTKTWYAWPIYKTETSDLKQIQIDRTRVLFFLYRSEVQKNEEREFKARKSHLWPFYSYWNDGNGNKQFQTISLFGTLFPDNQGVKETWNPIFAIYRYSKNDEGKSHSFLWDLISYSKSQKTGSSFYLGPLFERNKNTDNSNWSLFKGLVKRQKNEEEAKTSLFWGIISF